MPANILPGEAQSETIQEDECPYEEVLPLDGQVYGNAPGARNHYEVMENNEQDTPIYQNISRLKDNRKSVYGEGHYTATGCRCEGPWEPVFLKGISNYPPDTPLTLDNFLKNYESILHWFSNATVEQRSQEHVEFFLHTVLPDLESRLNNSGMTPDILNILLTLSCCKKCPLVNRYALYMILDLLSKTSYDSGEMFADFIVKCELHIKESILGKAQGQLSHFDHENPEDKSLRIFVYSRVLMILHVNIEQGFIPLAVFTTNENNNNKAFEALVSKLTELQELNQFVEKDISRYAICCIKETVTRLFPPKKMKCIKRENRFGVFLIWLQEQNRTGEESRNNRRKTIKGFLARVGWFDFHVAIFCLGSQIHDKPKNIGILRQLVEIYTEKHSECSKKWPSDGEWQTGLVLSSVLEDVVMHNENRDSRIEACLCLINYFASLIKKRNSLEKLWVRESLKHCLYGPVENVRQLILSHLDSEGKGKRRKEEDPKGEKENENLSIAWSMEFLVRRYKKHLQPRSHEFIMMNNLKGYFSAPFRGKKAIVKILLTMKDGVVREEQKDLRKAHQQLLIEAYFLRRLNARPHPNILKVYAYDTSAHPYHLITEQVPKGSLLQFVRNSRSKPDHMPGPSTLVKMMFGVIDALIYLDEQHLVHLAIMAANVLVGHDNVCKLTGFQFAREMSPKGQDNKWEYLSIHDDMPIRHAAPESLANGRFSEKSASWACGILLFEVHTYGVTPFNQFSNDESDKIRSHVISGGTIQMEECIQKEVAEIIQTCLRHKCEQRPSLTQLKLELMRTHDQLIKEDDYPRAGYPSLTNIDLAQVNNQMSCYALEKHDQEQNEGFFGSPTRSNDIAIIRSCNGIRVIRELVLKTKEEDLIRLNNLKHKNIVDILSRENYDARFIALVTEYSGRQNLLEFVLSKLCNTSDTIVAFVVQIVQAMKYMHDNNIIHSDLRAENIMVFHEKVKVARLGRSKILGNMVDIKDCMPQDAVRWSSPEVIKDGIYSHSSDVYSFGIMCFELFDALSAKEESTPDDVKPFPTLRDDQILGYLEGNNRPTRPESMPIWFYIAIKQCLLHKPAERPPFVLIEDCLTYRKPFESCLLSHWKTIHQGEIDNIDVNVTQPETAYHVIPAEYHKSFEELKQLVAVEVFMEHSYKYKPGHKDPEEENNNPKLDAQDQTYDRVVRLPKITLNGTSPDAIQEYDSDENLYDHIPYLNLVTANQEIKRRAPLPLPRVSAPAKDTITDDTSTDETRPVQETSSPGTSLRKSRLVFYSSQSALLETESSCSSLHHNEPSDFTYDDVSPSKKDVSRETPLSEEWPSLPAPPNREQLYSNIPYDNSARVSSSSSINNEQIPQDPYIEVGAVGGEPEEYSWDSTLSSNGQHVRNSPMDNDPTEQSWHSLSYNR